MTIAVVLLALAVAASVALLLRRERHRYRLAAALAASNKRQAALERRLHRTVPREQLSAALAARDALLHATEQPLLVFEPDGLLARANLAARARLGAVPGRRVSELGAPPAMTAAVNEALAGQDPPPFAMTIYEPSRRHFEVRVRGFSTAAGRGCVAALREDTAEADYRESRQLFSAGVSHELRTPLARILGLVETLALPLDDDEHTATIHQAQAEVEAMQRLIDEMILLAQLDIGGPDGGDGQARRADVGAEISAALRRHATAATDAGVELHGGSPRGLIAAIPPPLLATVLDNLVENAIRHAGGGAAVDVTARGLTGAVELTVSDTGRGIPTEHVNRVFERFYRADPARSGPGSGLGLAVVKHISEAHGGRASLAGPAGRGVTVRVVLPTPAASERILQGDTKPQLPAGDA